jgi:methionine-S-sulfoxide reductase
VLFDPSKVTYSELLDVYWHQIDPLNADRMFLDTGLQYSSAIFPNDSTQTEAAERSLAELSANNVFPGEIATVIVALDKFYPAERYHQDYYKNNALRYGFYRSLSGRDEFVQGVWGVTAWEKYTGHNVK